MITKEIILSIKKRREGGITDEQIKAILTNQEYSDEDIDKAIEMSYQDVVPDLAPPPAKKKSWWPF